MDRVLRFAGLWSIGDGIWAIANPKGWSRFWGRTLKAARRHPGRGRALGLVEVASGLYMATRWTARAAAGKASSRSATTMEAGEASPLMH